MTLQLQSSTCVCGDSNCLIPVGKCHCGCGQSAPISKTHDPSRRLFSGRPCRFIKGHIKCDRVQTYDEMRFKIDGIPCRLIALTKCQLCIVTEKQYESVSKHRWCAVWCKDVGGHYAKRSEEKNGDHRTILMHRELLGLEYGDNIQVDHENGNTLFNVPWNLRKATVNQNHRNMRKTVRNTSGRTGVSYRKRERKWYAYITIDNRMISLGCYRTFEEAARAREEAELKHFGDFRRRY